MNKAILAIAAFAAVFAAGAADLITAREATNIAEYVVACSTNGARTVDGTARTLPKYLHYAEFDDCYADEAAAWYARFGSTGEQARRHLERGGCSVLRRGNVVGRNFDWPLDEAAEFVVRVSPLGSRHGSVGIATLGTNLTERMVTSGMHTELYRVLPGKTVDGINDAGLVAEVNVIPYDPASSPTQSATRALHAYGVVRYALDNFGSAREAAEYVAAHYYIPEGSEYAYHWSFSDAEGSWIVEDGQCALATQFETMNMSMTNFRIWWIARFLDPETGTIDRAALAAEDPYGTGVERFEAMYGTEDVAAALEAARYTKTYLAATEPRRISEFAAEGVARVDESAALSNVAAQVIAAWPGREAARKQGVWWQTVHSSVYDIGKRTLAVAVQEDFSKRYVFRADETNERFRKVRAKLLAEVARASGVEARIIEEINAFKAFDIRVMDELPAGGEVGVVYLVKAEDYAETKTRDEYLWSQDAWRLIGSTRFDSDIIAKTVTTEPIPPDLTNRVSYTNSKTYEGETRDEDENGAVVIGKGAVGTPSPEYIRSLTNGTGKTVLRSASVAIGANAMARNADGKQAQSIAIGWNSRATGGNSIAIGSGAVHWYEDDETGPGAVASGGTSLALGYDAKATASTANAIGSYAKAGAAEATQIGRGENKVANSLKFQDTFVVKDGKVQGGVDTNEVEDISRGMFEPNVVEGLDEEITVRSHAITTYAPTGYVEEVAITPTGSRNYEIYIPNTAEVRERLPILFQTEIDGEVTRLGSWWTNKVMRLPAKATVEEPVPRTLILGIEEYATGWDWTPVVTRAFETNGWVRVEGTNLHFTAGVRIGGVGHAVKNPLYGVVNVNTNGVSGVTGELVGADGAVIGSFSVE